MSGVKLVDGSMSSVQWQQSSAGHNHDSDDNTRVQKNLDFLEKLNPLVFWFYSTDSKALLARTTTTMTTPGFRKTLIFKKAQPTGFLVLLSFLDFYY